MIYHENLRFLDKFCTCNNNLVLFLYTYMANFDFINLLARHVAVNYLKLKSNTSTVQRTASSIGFICKSLILCSTSSASDVYFISFLQFRTSHQRCSIKKVVLVNFIKFTGKHLCQSLVFNKVAGLCLGVQLY